LLFDWQKFLKDIAMATNGDFVTGFKMLGFVLYISRFSPEQLLSGEMVSPRTYYRWVATVNKAGWGAILSDLRFEQALQEYITQRGDNAHAIKTSVLQKLDSLLEKNGSL